MSSYFVLSAPASRDLDEILTHVLKRSGERRAVHVAEGFYEALEKIADNPGLGHRREDLTSSPLLFYSVWSWFVVYKPGKQPLEVARIIHAARDVEKLLWNEPA